jgi:membrane-associated protease RseP (regulator of RpoE activity)
MVLTTPRLGTLLAACGAIVALAGAPRGSQGQEPPLAPAPVVPPPRVLTRPSRPAPDTPALGDAWIGIGLACSRCSFQSEGKAIRRWIFSEPPSLTAVDRGSPADQAGLRGGDTLVAVDAQTLVSAAGGEAFANLRPGVAVRLTYRRDGRERTVSVTPVENPTSRPHTAEEMESRELARAYARSTLDAQREMERTQGERQRAQRDLQRALAEVRQNRGKILDSLSTQRMREAMEQAQRALEAQRSYVPYAPYAPSYPRVAPVAPVPPDAPVVSPGVEAPGYNVSPSGSLRYSRRLGEAIITARRPGRVTVVETGDSEVVLTGGDMWVRVALAPPGAVGPARSTVIAGFTSARSASGDEAAGIQGVVANPRLAAALGATSGVLVLDVQPRSHADSLGIRPGDVLVSLNGNSVVSIATERTALKRLRASTTARPGARSAVVVRARERRTLELGAPRASPPRPR